MSETETKGKKTTDKIPEKSFSEIKGILKEWCEELEFDWETEEEGKENEAFQAVFVDLKLPIKKGRLSMERDENGDPVFKYLLINPVSAGTDRIEMVNIREMDMDNMKTVDKYKEKERMGMSVAVIAKACGLIPGLAQRLSQRDLRIINVVTSSFFARSQPKEG